MVDVDVRVFLLEARDGGDGGLRALRQKKERPKMPTVTEDRHQALVADAG
jgi:hypothetical protein